jgi:exonuclease VII large subunit
MEDEDRTKRNEKLAIGDEAIVHNTSFASYDGLIVRIFNYLPNNMGYYVQSIDKGKERLAKIGSFQYKNVKAAPPSIFWFTVLSSNGETTRVPASCQVSRSNTTGNRSTHV